MGPSCECKTSKKENKGIFKSGIRREKFAGA